MCEFHYNFIKEKYGRRAKLFFIYTDISVYEIETNDVHWNFYMNEDMFDFMKYPENLRFYDVTNIKIVGKMKH